MCSEFWNGWFDKWGARHETRPAKYMVGGIDEMLSKGMSFSLYITTWRNVVWSLCWCSKPPMPLVSFDKVKLTNHTNLRHFMTETVHSRDIKTFEEMDMGWNSAFYSIRLPEILTPSLLMINEPHDFAQVFINGKYIG